MARKRTRNFSEVRHDGGKVWATAIRQKSRGARNFKIDVQVYRYMGQFAAQACIRKGNMRITNSPTSLKRMAAGRCGRANGYSPTSALRNALTKLTAATR